MTQLLVLSAALVAAGAFGVLVLHASSTLLLSLGIAASVFSGNSSHMGLPVPPDRVLIALGLFLLLVGVERKHLPVRLRFRTQHTLMLVLGVYATISAVVAGSLFGPAEGHYALLDRLSITAFVLFSVAPLVFHDHRRRNIFLVVIVAAGGYLGLTALLEGFGAKALAFPSYINDPSVGIHFERARGPIAESAGFGLALFECAVAAVVAVRTWEGRLARFLAGLVAAACLLGTLFTLTRAVWLGVGAGILVVCIISREWRRRLVPVVAIAGVVLMGVLTFSSSIGDQVGARSGDEGPIWDRLNLADAGVRAVQDRPFFGVGWRQFVAEGDQYYRLLPDIPQQGLNLDIHNAVLSFAAELGLVGASLWVAVVATTIGMAMFWRPPPELEDWRVAMVAMGVQWGVVAMSTPFAYTFSFFFVFTWAGIVTAHRFTRPRFPEVPEGVDPPADPPADAPPAAVADPSREEERRVHA